MKEGSVVKSEVLDSIKRKISKDETSRKSNHTHGNEEDYLKHNCCSKCKLKHTFGKCPAWDKICKKCKKLNHFAIACIKMK